jgi:hypothetical protein
MSFRTGQGPVRNLLFARLKHTPNAKTPSDHPVGRGSISHFGYIKMISPQPIGVKKIVPIHEAPIPTKVDPSKVDIYAKALSFRRASEARQEESAVRRQQTSRGCPILAAFPAAEISPTLERQGWDLGELREIQSIVLENRVRLLEAWNDFFGGSGG